MSRIKKYRFGICYAFIHFSVEVACFYFLFERLSVTSMWWVFALLFDALAFLPQNIIGLLNDKNIKLNIGFVGSILILLALVIPFDLTSLVLITLGNAMIHISGAEYTLHNAKGQIASNAIFVGGGSFGVITGQLLGLLHIEVFVLIPLILMVISCLMMFYIGKKYMLLQEETGFDIASNLETSKVVFFAFVAVVVRGYIAYAIPIEWNKTELQAIALFSFMGIGKMLGGVLADRIGYRKTTYLSLLGGLPFLLFGNSYMMISLIGIALFSMTMPVTIAIIVSKFPEMPGFSFGITTVALFCGTFPAFFVTPQSLFGHQVLVLVLSILALVFINIGIKKGK